MTNELIEKFIENDIRKDKVVKIHFKTRQTITGLFVAGADYGEMKKKNFWRIVVEAKQSEWETTNNLGVSRLFSGSEFTRLTDV